MSKSFALRKSLPRIASLCLCALLSIGLYGQAIAATAPAIWLAGVPPFARTKMFQETESDYLDLFRPDAPWSNAASHVQVFLTNGGLILRESDDVLKNVFADLKRRHMALAVEVGLLAGKDREGHQACGVGVEGFSAPDQTKVIADIIKKLGGSLDYIVMDEPLWYGHNFHGTNACKSSVGDIAREVAMRVATIRQIFPAVQIGDEEPVAILQPTDWMEEVAQWLKAYRQAVGEPLNIVNADVQWTGPWQRQLPLFKNIVKASGSKFGIIYDGGGSGNQESDRLWTQEAENRFRAVEADPSLVPDLAILQTWARWPHRMLPETQPGTMTNLVNRYVSPR
jgi:hypothetical protein